jgi:hypothetical protein
MARLVGLGFTVQSILRRVPIVVAPVLGGLAVARFGIQGGVRLGLLGGLLWRVAPSVPFFVAAVNGAVGIAHEGPAVERPWATGDAWRRGHRPSSSPPAGDRRRSASAVPPDTRPARTACTPARSDGEARPAASVYALPAP